MSLEIPKQYASLKFIRPISWPEIFDEWRRGEAHQKEWKKHWEERGYSSWDEWRKAYSSPLEPEKLEWFLYEIEKPLEDVPKIFGVPSYGWIKKAYGGEKTKKLGDILDLDMVSQNPKVIDIKKSFPQKTMLSGLVFEDKIILIEGMHRSLALAGWESATPLESKVFITLARWHTKEIPEIGSGHKNKN